MLKQPKVLTISIGGEQIFPKPNSQQPYSTKGNVPTLSPFQITPPQLTDESILNFRSRTAENGYAVLAVHNAISGNVRSGKNPKRRGWQNTPKGIVPDFTTDALNTGILCNGLRVLDIDIDCPIRATQVEEHALRLLGDAPKRKRANSSRIALLYRASEGSPKRRAFSGEHGEVEILGHGRQLVVHGTHYSGTELLWENGGPDTTKFDELPVISEEQITAFGEAILSTIGGKSIRELPASSSPQDTFNDSIYERPTLTCVREILFCIPANNGYHEGWSDCMMAVHNATEGSLEGLDLIDEWSATSKEDYPGRRIIEGHWKSYDTDHKNPITFGSLIDLAKQYSRKVPEILHQHPNIDVSKLFGPLPDISHLQNVSLEKPKSNHVLFQAKPYRFIDPKLIPPRDWIYDKHFIRKFVSVTIAPGGLGKSSLVMAEALALALGHDLLGKYVKRPHRVWYWNLEDPMDELDRRIGAVRLHFDISEQDLEDRLFVNSGRETELKLAEMQPRGGIVIFEPVVENLICEIRRNKIDVLIVDPFVSCHSINENDNNAVDLIVKKFAKIADQANCAVELVHHSRKTGGEEISTESARGGKALTDASRDTRVLNRMTENEATKLGANNHRSHFRVYSDKSNLAPPLDDSDWYKIQNLHMPNGDDVGVVISWKPRDFSAELNPEHFNKIYEELKTYEEPLRSDEQANEWCGHIFGQILRIDTGKGISKEKRTAVQNQGRAKIKTFINLWIEEGRISKYVRKISNGRNVPCIRFTE